MNTDSDKLQLATWRNSTDICALADGERHLGHILLIGGRWFAFDATHLNEGMNGFRELGSFASQGPAREAVELSSGAAPSPLRYAGAA